MSETKEHTALHNWNKQEIFLFRIVFIFLLLLTIPLDPAYYSRIFRIQFFHLHFQDLFQITNDVPRLLHLSNWGIASYAGWGIAFIIAIVGAFIWGAIDKSTKRNYDHLYYWLRVVIRYRLALGLIGYGVIKLFPVQLPTATLSDLHTAYGDFLPWKIYYLSTGVSSAYYEQTLGAIEVLTALLLICRRTAVIGAGIAIAVLTNIVLINFAYQLGEHVYSVYLLLAALFILAYDIPRLYHLLVKEGAAKADHFEPLFVYKNTHKFRYGLKAALLVFTVGYSILTYIDFKKSKWPYPDQPGLSNAYGVYNVREFSVNNVVLPYSATDSTRWQDVVFEKWNVLSIKANKHFPIDLSSPEIDYQASNQRSYESKGNGGRAFYSYAVTGSTIKLFNKNVPSDREVFHISRPDPSTIVLNGINNHGDSLNVVLDKLNKEYLLNKGRRKPVSVY